MTSETTYQGWTNYETWAVALWIDNEQSSYGYWREQAREAYRNASATTFGTFERSRLDVAASDLADMLKDEIEEGNPLANDSSLYSDLISAAIGETNWREIARSWVEEVAPEIDKEEEEEEEEEEENEESAS